MGAVGDRVSDFWNTILLSWCSVFMLEMQMFPSCTSSMFFSVCPQGFPGFRGKPGITGIIGKTVSLFLFVMHVEIKTALGSSLQPVETAGPINE